MSNKLVKNHPKTLTKEEIDKVPQWVWNTIEESLDSYLSRRSDYKYNEEKGVWERLYGMD